MIYFTRPRVKQWGWVVLFGVLCFGAGNYHETQAAIDGTQRWWQQHEKRDLTAAQSQAWKQCIASYWQ